MHEKMPAKMTTVLGLPLGQYFEPGLHRVASFTLMGCTISPCYINVDEVDENTSKVTYYGMQTHLMQSVAKR